MPHDENSQLHIRGFSPADLSLMKDIAREAATMAVAQTFRVLGVDVDDPLQIQRDMAHLRQWRKIFDGAVGKLMVVGVFAVLGLGLFYVGLEVTHITEHGTLAAANH